MAGRVVRSYQHLGGYGPVREWQEERFEPIESPDPFLSYRPGEVEDGMILDGCIVVPVEALLSYAASHIEMGLAEDDPMQARTEFDYAAINLRAYLERKGRGGLAGVAKETYDHLAPADPKAALVMLRSALANEDGTP